MKKRKNIAISNSDQKTDTNPNAPIESALASLSAKRTGGSVNLRGIGFQVLYSSWVLLDFLDDETSVTLEGLEDVDIIAGSSRQHIQVKSSVNPIDAAGLWNLKVLQHFWEVFQLTPDSNFRLVHNTTITKGSAGAIGSSILLPAHVEYWRERFASVGIELSMELFQKFLNHIIVEKISVADLIEKVRALLFERYGINKDSELQFFKSLFYHVFDWSVQRKTVLITDLKAMLQSVSDSFSKFPANPAVQHNWIKPISFETAGDDISLDYYDGKAARPEDIANGLPVRRLSWEDQVVKALDESDAIIIKSSSGQGKSTLAWQACYVKRANYSIYQVHKCSSYEEAAAVNDFLSTRVAIGEFPIIVIDGLTSNFSAWTHLAAMISNQPVKLIITTREEDWVRFGGDESKISLKVIDIRLSVYEAETIYKLLKERHKISSAISAWQPAWERVKDKALLIEYIFILTQGLMIEERLRHQVSLMAKENAGVVKMDILRIIAMADVLSVKISTTRLSRLVQNRSASMDANELFRQLEKEYYLNFERGYVEGLHPVRSKHLVELLHSHTSIDETLLTVLDLVDEHYIYDYFIAAPLWVVGESDFYRRAAAIVSGKSLHEIVFAIDGLMHTEPYRFWLANKQVFDDTFANGGMEIFIADAIPFNKVKTLPSLSESMPGKQGENVRHLLREQAKLTRYDINGSAVFRFVAQLRSELTGKKFTHPEGISFLYKWFKRVGVELPDLLDVDEEHLLKHLSEKPIGESAEFFHYYRLAAPAKFQAFIEKNKSYVIGWLKRKTNTLTIEERGNDIQIEYLVENNPGKVNEYSMFRIITVQAILGHYDHYCTDIIILPFPNEELYKAVIQDGHKAIPAENLFDDFDVHINQIWLKTIRSLYAASSSYEWQQEFTRLREKAVNLSKKCTRLLEAHLEKNNTKVDSLVKSLVTDMKDYLQSEVKFKKYPAGSPKYFEKSSFEPALRSVSQWLFSLNNFVNQFSRLISPQTLQDQRLPLINLRSAVHKLPGMHEAFATIERGSHKYFETPELMSTEKNWYSRLLATCRYFVKEATASNGEKIIVAARAVSEWDINECQRKLDELHQVINDYAQTSGFVFYLPSEITEDESLNYATIGISGIDPANEDDLWDLSTGLMRLADTDIDFFRFILVDEERKAMGGLRFTRHYFDLFKKVITSGQLEEDSLDRPIPVFPDEEMLSVLNDVSVRKVIDDSGLEELFTLLSAVWKIAEARKRLDPENAIERNWLAELEEAHTITIRNLLPVVYGQGDFNEPAAESIEQFLRKEKTFDKEEIVSYLVANSLRIAE